MTVARDELLETERERVTRQFEAGGSLGLSPAEKVERLSQLRRAKVYLSLTASRRKPPRSPASHNPLKPCPSLARWSGSKRRRRKAEPFKSPADTPKCPECCGNQRLLCRGTSSSNPGESANFRFRRRATAPRRHRARRFLGTSDGLETAANWRGTESSNPVPSSGESYKLDHGGHHGACERLPCKEARG